MARKDVYCSPSGIELSINLAVGIFNDGFSTTMCLLFQATNINISPGMMDCWKMIDNLRDRSAIYKASATRKQHRKLKRRNKYQKIAAFQHKEGIQYKSSFFYEPERQSNLDRTCKTKKEKRNCPRCGSTTHERSSHKSCPKNKKYAGQWTWLDVAWLYFCIDPYFAIVNFAVPNIFRRRFVSNEVVFICGIYRFIIVLANSLSIYCVQLCSYFIHVDI